MSKITSSLIVSVVFLFSTSSYALPLGDGNFGADTTETSIQPLGNYDFEGIVALSNCSGSLIQLEGALDTDPALVLTNGHCNEGGFIAPGTYLFGLGSSRNFNVVDRSGKKIGRVTARQVVYGTMTKTDMLIYKLRESYADIKLSFGVEPLRLSSVPSKIGDNIEIISGYWRRGYSCSVEKYINELREDKWTWKDSIRYSRPGCETIGGTSGSPVLLAGSRTVIAVNNTGNEDGENCSMNNPCEIDELGNKTAVRGYSYAEQTWWVYTCLNNNRELDLNIGGCLLPH